MSRVKPKTERERKIVRIIDSLYRKAIEDERKAIAFYNRIADEFQELLFYDEARALRTIAETEDLHRQILSDLVSKLETIMIARRVTDERYEEKKEREERLSATTKFLLNRGILKRER